LAEYWDIGDPIYTCEHCKAYFWFEERLNKSYKSKTPKYSLCCLSGKIELPRMKRPPKLLEELIFGNNVKSNHFLENIRSYNSMFSFTSMGGKIDRSLNTGKSPSMFRMHGQNYHLIGSLIPPEGSQPKFAQLYIYDTQNELVVELKQMLDDNNVLVKSFRMVKEKIEESQTSEVKLRLIGKRGNDPRRYNLPLVSEVAALIVGDFDESLQHRDIIVETQSGKLKRISELHACYLGLQYPLLFPYGEDGYQENIPFSGANAVSKKDKRKRVSFREFFAYRLHERQSELPIIMSTKRLFQQFIVDAYTMVESNRLSYVRRNQKKLRAEMYKGLSDALIRGENDPTMHGKRVILPSSFTGGARYMIQNYQDAMAICRWVGYPDLFITFTCNPKWPEIVRYVEKRGLKPEDRPDIIARVFKIKLDNMIKDFRKNKIFGTVKAVVYTVEFQKRGLPHAHILLFLSKEHKHPTAEHIDNIISAEIPDPQYDGDYYKSVQDFMMHGPCGATNKNSPCMSNGRCTKYFPKKFIEASSVDEDGYPVYKRRDNGRFVEKGGVILDNRYVVPHNRYLLMKYGAHINVEWCNQSRSIKYLFKYINKGHDRVTASFYESSRDDEAQRNCDEVKMYYDCRYISPCEAAWRIFKFDIQYRDPAVERLSFHLPGEQSVIFTDSDPIDVVLDRATVKQSMFLSWFEVRGPRCYEDIRCINGVQYTSFRDACYSLGLLDDDIEYIDGINEASQWASASSLRNLFATLLASDSLAVPEKVWDKCWSFLSDDILYNRRILLQHPDLILAEDEIKNCALIEIEKLLRSLGRSLRDFATMPFPTDDNFQINQNRLIIDELQYDRIALEEEYRDFLQKCTYEQRHVHDKVLSAVNSNSGGMFFVYGYGGTGKTFVWKGLSAALRSKGDIVINVASSGIASLLLPGGRTAHSRFKIPLNPNEDSTCNIKQGSDLANLIIRAKLIIWDEAPMMHKFCFEALDKTLRDIMRFSCSYSYDVPFGRKTIVFGGDFRQILPVIPKGTRQDVVNATINSSYLWKSCTVLRLTKNMRLGNARTNEESIQLEQFAKWIASVGDGILGGPNDGEVDIELPDDILIKYSGDPICEGRQYLSSDKTCTTDSTSSLLHDIHTPEFLNSLKCSGVPNHELYLKVGTPVMLLRNIDHANGLCNGTRLVITRLGSHVLEAKVITGHNAGNKVLIPRMSLTPSDPRLPFRFQRKQFPVIVSYAMTINKSQGQSLNHVGLFLKKPVFSHGQLYVAISRVTNRSGLKILICENDGDYQKNATTNVVYKEVLQNI
ncbi:uncharacterized protein LOC131007083, partial [Salvia miltiorrhiza]|uniref:uncharacterized protein LOC131007083 n=1 Tax=Salvia miltiorrhiza TaxID=226208 RepID=UPI0025ACC139